jgi:Resolvase, N terminal domain
LSTDRQGKSGLGLEAQREAVLNYLNGGSWTLVADFTEVESGKHSDRPQLAAALAACKKHKARLVIAKLDRLSRNLAFIAALMDSGVEFIAVDPTPPLQLASTPRGGRAKARHLHGLDKFTRRAVLFPVSKEEGFERQLASCGVATQPQCCAERDQRRRQIANRGAVGDVTTNRPCITDLNGGKAPQQLAEIRVKPAECGGCFAVAYSRADTKTVRRLLDLVEPNIARDQVAKPSIAYWRDHSAGASRRRVTPIPQGNRPSTAACHCDPGWRAARRDGGRISGPLLAGN